MRALATVLCGLSVAAGTPGSVGVAHGNGRARGAGSPVAAALARLAARSPSSLSVAAAARGPVPRVVSGVLSPPSRARPDAIADRFLADWPELSAAPAAELGRPQVASVGAGWVARYRQLHAGLPVIGGELVLRIDARGRVVRLAQSTFALDGVTQKPRVDAAAALAAARARGATGVAHPASTALAIDPRASGGPRLVWAVRLDPTPELLENAIYLIDAADGRVLKRIDLLRYAKANVFIRNPIEQPTPAAQDIPATFTPTTTDHLLTSELLQGLNCIDKGESSSFMGIAIHKCSVTQTAISDAGGDFSAYQPASEPFKAPLVGCPNSKFGTVTVFDGGDVDSGAPADELEPLDEFSEQHMYWHVATSYTFFRALLAANGVADFKLRQKPLPVAVNLCTPDFSNGFDPTALAGPLVPFNNAFFSPGANNPISAALVGGRDSIMFGQGPSYDFAYDGDVIYHEFTHAVIDTLGKLADGGFEDAQGLNDDPGAMNEGLADYFSSAIGGDPAVGEYAGRNIPGAGAEGAIRDLTNQDLCADDRWGEVHQDSQAFSAGLWAARVAIAGDPKAAGYDANKAQLYDRSVLAAIQAFADGEDMTTAAEAVASEVAMLLDANAKQAVTTAFGAHKILPVCSHVIDWTGKKKDVLFLDGIDSPYAPSGAGRVPGYVQWKVDVPPGADTITASMTIDSQGGGLFGGSAPVLELAVGPPGAAIVWNVGTDGGNQAATSMFSAATGMVTAKLTGLAPGPSYVMILNSGGSGSIGRNIGFATSCSDPMGCAVAADAGTDGPVTGNPSAGGCGCELGGKSAAPWAALALCALLLLTLFARRAGS